MRSRDGTNPIVNDVVPPELQRELARVYARASELRRRRRNAAPGSIIVLFVAAAIAIGLVAPFRSSPPTTPQPSATFPTAFLAIASDVESLGAGQIGSLVLVSSESGDVIRTLAAGVNVAGGLALSPDGRTAYWTAQGRSPALVQSVIWASSTRGGVSRRVAVGFDPAVSPNGQYLAYWTGRPGAPGKLGVLNLRTGTKRTFNLWSNDKGAPPVWAGDSHQVAALNLYECPPTGVSCKATRVPRPSVYYTAVNIDAPASAGAVTGLVSVAAVKWPELSLVGGPRPGTLVASIPNASGPPHSTLVLLDIARAGFPAGSPPVEIASLPGRPPVQAPTFVSRFSYLESVSPSGRYALVSGSAGTAEQFDVVDLLAHGRVLRSLQLGSGQYLYADLSW